MMFSLEVLLAAFGGGAFGALVGAIPAFVYTGLMGLIGVAVLASGGPATIVNDIAFGTLFGPHIAFAGGVAAAAFAANRRHHLDSGMDVLTPLIKTKDASVLLVGGAFGVLGAVINIIYASVLKLPTDTVAMTVVTSGLIARLIFGSTGIFGKSEIAATSEEEKRRFFPDSKTILFNVIWALGLGFVVSYLVNLTQINIIGFCISASSLMFLQMGFEFPVSHHISLVAGYATMATGSIFVGAGFAVIAWIVGEIFGKCLNSYCDTHIDPPAGTIFLCSFFIFTLL